MTRNLILSIIFCCLWIHIEAKANVITLRVPYDRHRCIKEAVPKQFSYKVDYEVISPLLPEDHHQFKIEDQKFRLLIKHTETSRMLLFNGSKQKGSYMWSNTDGRTRILQTCVFNYHQEDMKIRIETTSGYELGDVSVLPFSNINKSIEPQLQALEKIVQEITPSQEYLLQEEQQLELSQELFGWISNYGRICIFVMFVVLILQTLLLKKLLEERKSK